MIIIDDTSVSVLGIVTEYNPFHNGHAYHIKASKEKTGSRAVVAVMSGHFVQRGEPAIADKWTRAKWALQNGVDLVIELPFLFATSSSEHFAFGAVSLLNALGCVDTLCFGSESGSIDSLNAYSQWQIDHKEDITAALKNNPALSFSEVRDKLGESTMNRSNDILGISYLMSLNRLNSPIKAFTIERIANQYKQKSIEGTIASATAIRESLKLNTQSLDVISATMPLSTAESIFSPSFESPSAEALDLIVLSFLRLTSLKALSEIHDMPTGFEHRLKKAALSCQSVEALVTLCQTKHLTKGRIQRIIVKALLGVRKEDLLNDCQTTPGYIRILGFNETGKKILRQSNSNLPLITNVGKAHLTLPSAIRQLEFDCMATDLYALLFDPKKPSLAGQDFYQSPLSVK